MKFQRLVTAIFLFALWALSAGVSAQNSLLLKTGGAAGGAVISTAQVYAELLAWAPEGVAPGKPLWLGLQLTHQPQWHTYWKNSGDSGLPTQLDWQLPPGITAGETAWPTPKKISIGTLANYGYEGAVLLPVPLTVAPGFKATQLNIKLKASWLVCRKECIPQEGEFALSIPAQGSTAASGLLFQAAFDATPKSLATGASRITVSGQTLKIQLAGLPAALQGKTLVLFPETASVIEPAAPWQQAWEGALWTAQVPLSTQRSDSPASLPLVVALNESAYRITAPVTGGWPAAAAPAVVSPALEAALKANAAMATGGASAAATSANAASLPPNDAAPVQRKAPALGLFAALIGALLGGLILNLMPCVFPVLAIKMVGFVQMKDQSTRLTTGLAYTAGVVLSFLALGALLLGLRAAGEQLGWGFQLQNPAVVAGLAALFTLLGLNLAGMFDFGNLLPLSVINLQAKNPGFNAFLSGMLATAVASPCTAPFMGASLGYAVGLPAVEALAVFGAIGAGMAAPYLLASAVPAVARAMPRPGAWMVVFKQLMAFPMFATAAWLVWVLGQQSGIDGAGALLALLVLLALAVWALGLRGLPRRVIATVAIALGIFGLWSAGPIITAAAQPLSAAISTASAASASSAASPASANDPARWQDWQPGRVEALTAQGRSVFVDFTAAWCVTCQYNKKTTLANAEVLADMAAKNVALLRADWTRRDPAITAALARLGRSGVPVYVLYQSGHAPVVLSEILSVSDVRAELARL